MTHEQITEQISLWLDDQLDPAEETQLQTHLADCAACRRSYQAMQQVDQLFRAAGAVMAAPAPGFIGRVEARLARQRPVKPWQPWAAIVALLLGTLLFGGAALLGGATLLSAGAALLDASYLYQVMAALLDSVDNLRFLLNFGALFVKASLITMQQPLFWIGLLLAAVLISLWVRVLQMVSDRGKVITQLI